MTSDTQPWVPTPGRANGLPTTEDWQTELRIRRDRFWGIVQAWGCDAGLVFGSPEHNEAVRYLTRFVPALGDVYGVLAGPERFNWMMNFHWQLAEARELSDVPNWHAQFDLAPLVVEAVAALRPKRLAVVWFDRIPYPVLTALSRALPGVEFVDAAAGFNRIRRIKTPIELALLREAARVTDLAINTARNELAVDQTEAAVAARITQIMHAQGATSAFQGLVMVGNDRGEIARMPRNRAIEAGDTVTFDVGAACEGYQTDVARTYVMGRPSDAQRKAWDAVCRTRDAVLALAKPGTRCCELHATAVRILSDAGYVLRHRIGHGYGLGTSFEWPSVDTETAQLEAGMTLAIEPGVYEVGIGAVKCEDDIVVTAHGCDVLSHATTDFVVRLDP